MSIFFHKKSYTTLCVMRDFLNLIPLGTEFSGFFLQGKAKRDGENWLSKATFLRPQLVLAKKPENSVPNWFSVLFYDSYHICYGLESIFLHVLLDAVYNIHCNCRIVEVCCSHRHCTCTCEYHLNCIFC